MLTCRGGFGRQLADQILGRRGIHLSIQFQACYCALVFVIWPPAGSPRNLDWPARVPTISPSCTRFHLASLPAQPKSRIGRNGFTSDGKRVRLFTRNGHDWTARYPRIVAAALRNRNSSFVIDGEAVLLDADGHSDFNGLHSRKHDAEIELYAFDCLALAGDDLRGLPLHLRKAKLARLLARRVDGIHPASFEQGEIGPNLFQHACLLGLEGLVSNQAPRVARALLQIRRAN